MQNRMRPEHFSQMSPPRTKQERLVPIWNSCYSLASMVTRIRQDFNICQQALPAHSAAVVEPVSSCRACMVQDK